MLQTILGSDIYTVDALYFQPKLASIHLIKQNNRIAIVDTGTKHSVPQIAATLKQLGLGYEHVDFVILTHVHLDHAGGASELMRLCENAQLVVHPRGARHMQDPSKLIAGSIAVHGQARFDELYGGVDTIDAERMLQPTDGETIDFAGRALTFIDTPGHANHHHCIIDAQSNSAFTGDTLGFSYQALRSDDHAFIAPSTSPVQFDPEALHASIDKVMAYQPSTLYLTHYSAVTPNAKNIAGLHEQIDDFVMLTQQASESPDAFEHTLLELITDYLAQRCHNELPELDRSLIRDWVQLDAVLNAQGLVYWWQHKRVA